MSIGEFATIAAGVVVNKDVVPHALMAGVPSKRIGWVCECGQVLDKNLYCKYCGRGYVMKNSTIEKIERVLLKSINCLILEGRAA